MRVLVAALLASLLVAPLAGAVGGDAASPTPGVNQPASNNGNNGSAPAQESVETAPGVSWYALVLLGSLAVALVLAFVLVRQGRSFRRRP